MSELDLEEHRLRIRRALAAQRWPDAAALLAAWTRRFPEQAHPWSLRAQCLERCGELEAALECARRARVLAPEDGRYTEQARRLEGMAAAQAGPAVSADEGATGAPPPTLREGDQGSHTPSQASAEVEATIVDREAAAPGVPDVTLLDASATGDGSRPARSGPPPPDPTAVDRDGDLERTAVEDAWATLHEEAIPTGPGRPAPPRSEATGGWAPGGVIAGRYEVRGLRRGGMGEVYFVHDRELGMDIAIKTPLPSALASEAGRQRFLREAEAWVALGLHPNICSAYYVSEIDGVPRLFLEYVEGGSLEEWLRSHPDAPVEERLDLAIQIAAGMQHAHTFLWSDEDGREQQGLVHRDLKPANVLVGLDGMARVTDFGLVGRDAGEAGEETPPASLPSTGEQAALPTPATAREGRITSIWSTMTMAGRVLGSPAYMAPEQWGQGHRAGRPADVYAFGCILYELLAGGRPFALDPRYRDADPQARLVWWRDAHRSQAPRDPRSRAPGLDEGLAALMLACLAKDPAQRPPSFAELGAGLRAAFRRLRGRDCPRADAEAVALPADSLNNRGVSFACLGQRQRAERAWREALAGDPRHPQAAYNLALAEWRRGGVTDQEVAGRLTELRRRQRDDWRRIQLAGRLALLLGGYDEALECLHEAAGSSRNASESVRDLAMALCAAASESADEEAWRRLVALLRQVGSDLRADPVMLVCYALAIRRLGDEESSRRLWAQARRQLDSRLASLELAATGLLPGTQLVRRTDPPLGRITAVAVASSGAVATFGTETGAVALLDPASGEVRTLRGHGGRIRAVAVAPGRGLALTAEEGQPLTSWSLSTGERRGLQAHPGYLNALCLDRDEKIAAGASSTGALVLWDLTTSRRTAVVPAHSGFAVCAALSEDGARAVSGGADGNLVVVDVGKQAATATLAAHPGGVRAVAVSPDGRFALSGGADGLCRLWDLGRAGPVAAFAGHDAAITFAAVAPGAERALSGSADGTLRHWDLTEGRVVKSERTGGAVSGGAASADWGVVTAAHGATLSQYRMSELPRYRPAWAVAHLVTSSEAEDRAQRFRQLLAEARADIAGGDLEKARDVIAEARAIPGYERATAGLEAMEEASAPFPRAALADGWEERVLRGHEAAVTSLVVIDSDQAVSCGRDRRLLLWSWRRGEAAAAVETPSVPLAACPIGDTGLVATADLDGGVRLFEVAGQTLDGCLQGHEGQVHDVACDATGEWLLSAGRDGTARLWEVGRRACRHVLEGHLGQVLACAIAPDRRLAATGGDDGTLLLWDPARGRGAGQLDGHAAPISHLEWSPDGRTLLSVGGDAVRLWSTPGGRCLRTIEGGGDKAVCATSSEDARFVAVGRAGGSVELWRLRDRALLRAFDGHAGAVTALAFAPEGHRLLSAGADGSLRVWYLDWQPEVRPFVDWHDSATPHLEVFLAQRTPPDGGLPSWSEPDLEGLLAALRRRGLGWISAQGVRARLDELARELPRRPSRRKPGPKITPRAREGLRRHGLGVLRAAVVMVPLLLLAAVVWSHRQLHLEAREARTRRAHNLTLIVAPTLTTGSAPCDSARFTTYLEDYTRPTDSLRDWSEASHCLVQLADPRSVEPLLDLLRRPPESSHPITGMQIGADPRQVMAGVRQAMSGGLSTTQAVQSMLARMGRPVVRELARHLDDPSEDVRGAAAAALALGGSEVSTDALVNRARDRNPAVRRVVARQIADLAVGKRLAVDEAFALATEMARDEDAGVRLAVARQLRFFAGRRAEALARQLVADEDPEVSRTALDQAL